jgi:hypothetical protein
VKLTIDHSRTKRAIDGPFSLCGSRKDLESLARQILGTFAVDDIQHQDGHGRASYLWVNILARVEADPITNTRPLTWDSDETRKD